MSFFPEGCSKTEKEILNRCPLVTAFFGAFASRRDNKTWLDSLEEFRAPLRADLKGHIGKEAYDAAIVESKQGLRNKGLVSSGAQDSEVSSFMDQFLLMGYEIGSVKNVHIIYRPLGWRLLMLDVLDLSGPDIRGAEVAREILRPFCAGAKYRESLEERQKLKIFVDFINGLPEKTGP